jgi:hypothetical protein
MTEAKHWAAREDIGSLVWYVFLSPIPKAAWVRVAFWERWQDEGRMP